MYYSLHYNKYHYMTVSVPGSLAFCYCDLNFYIYSCLINRKQLLSELPFSM